MSSDPYVDLDFDKLTPGYLDLLKRSLTGILYEDPDINTRVFVENHRHIGSDWPYSGKTMIGMVGLGNTERLVKRVIADKVEGDLVECGVWRGGTCIFMQGILTEHNETHRQVWVVDSFRGLPPPIYPIDPDLASVPCLAVPLPEVKHNFELYNLLGSNVHFLEGWFEDTLPTAPIEKIAYLRLDGDLYKSTMDTLENLYPKLSSGGFIDIDDYPLECCRTAVEEYRTRMGITEHLRYGPGVHGVYWRKP